MLELRCYAVEGRLASMVVQTGNGVLKVWSTRGWVNTENTGNAENKKNREDEEHAWCIHALGQQNRALM